VLVNATRFPEEVRKLPASVSVITSEDIAQSAARTLPELLSSQAGITMKDFFGNNAASTGIDLRGFGVTGPQNTLILVDGRRLSDIDLSSAQWATIPLAAVERIEIVRGSGAVLYGDGASTGVINIVTRSPLGRGLGLDAFARAASYDTLEGQLLASYAQNGFGVNASAYGYGSDGYRANNRNQQKNATVNLRWALGATTLDLRGGSDRQDLRLPGARRVQPSIGLNEYASDPRGAQTPLDYSNRNGQRAGLTLARRLGEAELAIGYDWRDKDQNAYFDQNGFSRYQADTLELRALTPRLRIPFAAAGVKHRLTLGADWNKWSYDSRRSNLPENASQPINHVRTSQDTQGYYFQDLVEVTPALQLLAGWRSERVNYTASDTLDATAPGYLFQTAAPPVQATQKQNAWDLGLRYALGTAVSLFARAGRSFRFVNVDEIYENDALFAAQFQILNPQHAITYEAGAEIRGHAGSVRAALFRIDVHDEIHLDPFSAGVGNTNYPPSRRSGIELEASWKVTRDLRITAGYAYTDARFLEGTLVGGPFAIDSNIPVAGKTVPLVPRNKLNAAFVWDLGAATRFSGALTSLSSQYMDNDEPNTLGTKIPAYTLLDLKLSRDVGWGRLALTLNNLLDADYYTYAVRSPFIADRYAVYPLPGRSFGISVEVKLP
jgi:iron complex outermembrane receptor protein